MKIIYDNQCDACVDGNSSYIDYLDINMCNECEVIPNYIPRSQIIKWIKENFKNGKV